MEKEMLGKSFCMRDPMFLSLTPGGDSLDLCRDLKVRTILSKCEEWFWKEHEFKEILSYCVVLTG